MKKRRKYLALFLLIVISMAVFILSSQDGETSSKLSASANTFFSENPKIKYFRWNYARWSYSIPIRKVAHIFLFSIIGVILMSLLDKVKYQLRIVIATGCLMGALDELHQFFVSGRTATASDVFIDVLGVLIGISLYYVVVKLKKCLGKGEKTNA